MKRNLLMVVLASIVGFWGVDKAYSEVLCVNPEVALCFSTIQEAVDAASTGDEIVISPNLSPKGYNENVVVTTPDLTIRGKGKHSSKGKHSIKGKRFKPKKVIIDGCETTDNPTECGGNGFEVRAAGITIKNLTIRHAYGGVAIMPGGDDTTIENISFLDNFYGGVETIADDPINNIKVINCEFEGTGSYISLWGHDATVRGNTFINAGGIDVYGDGARVISNVLKVTVDIAIVVDGDNALITRNLIEACAYDGIKHWGENSTISFNTIKNMPKRAIGISANGNDLTIRKNDIRNASGKGLYYHGDFSTIDGNIVERSGGRWDPGIWIRGDNNMITKNISRRNSSAGILHYRGDNNIYRGNICTKNAKSGIRIETGSDNIVDGNKTLDNHGEGINNGVLWGNFKAINTIITNNMSLRNRTDICNDGTIAEFSGNNYDTGGPETACVVQQ